MFSLNIINYSEETSLFLEIFLLPILKTVE
jgi:hypothetical protein